MRRTTSLSAVVTVFVSFLGVALLQAWPLPLRLTTALTGLPTGDTGVYVWNTWVFGHELRTGEHGPFFTSSVFALDSPTDLALHNYTAFSDAVALPLQNWLGIVGAFNVAYLLNVALAGLGMFLLARWIWRSADGGTNEAWLAALLFACAPFLVARSTDHFSLAAAAPLPFFVLCFDRMWESRRVRDAVAAGACVAWAAYCDAYYGVYCVMLGLCLAAAHCIRVSIAPRGERSRRFVPMLDVPIGLLVLAVVVIHAIGGGAIRIAAWTISMRSLYTPVLLLTTLVLLRVLVTLRPSARWTPPFGRIFILAAVLAVTTTTLMAPVLYAAAKRSIDGRLVSAPVLWRSSAPGVDAVSWLLPNPNHPLAPESMVDWVRRQPGQYAENVASLPWVALLVIVAAWRMAGHRPHARWTAICLGFATLAMGPFVRVGEVETFVPTPWTLLRYMPFIGEARMPTRFSVVVIMGLAVIFAGALTALVRRYPARRRVILATVAIALSFELLPAPRTLHSAEIPSVYDTIARDPRDLRVLDLPFGIRDGLSSLGDFNASSLYYQTRHEKSLLGGYLSRISQVQKDRYLQHPAIGALFTASEGRPLTPDERARAIDAAPAFVRDARLGWVVIDERRTSAELMNFAIEAMRLTPVDRSGSFVLYTTEHASARPN